MSLRGESELVEARLSPGLLPMGCVRPARGMILGKIVGAATCPIPNSHSTSASRSSCRGAAHDG